VSVALKLAKRHACRPQSRTKLMRSTFGKPLLDRSAPEPVCNMFSDNPRSGITPKPDCQDRHYGLCFSIRLIVRAFLDPDRRLAASTVLNNCCQVELSISPDVADLWVYPSLLFVLRGFLSIFQRRVYGIDGMLRIPTQQMGPYFLNHALTE
jgi:hypothetical protein